MAAGVPHINIYDSLLHEFDFTPRIASDLYVTITRVEEATYILQYRKDTTGKKEYRVSRIPDQWKVEQVDLSPTSFAHTCYVDRVLKTHFVDDQRHLLPNRPVPSSHNLVPTLGIAVIGIAGYGAKTQFQHRNSFLGVVFITMGIAYAFIILAFRGVSKQAAFAQAGRLIAIIDRAEKNAAGNTDPEYLFYSRDQYK